MDSKTLKDLKDAHDKADNAFSQAHRKMSDLIEQCADPKEIAAAYAEKEAAFEDFQKADRAYRAALQQLSKT